MDLDRANQIEKTASTLTGSDCAIVVLGEGKKNQYIFEKHLKLLSKSVRDLNVVKITGKTDFYERTSEEILLEMKHNYYVVYIGQERSQKV